MSISMNQLCAMAAALVEAEKETERKEGELKVAKENERKLREETVPAALQELGVSKITLETGQVVSVKQDVYVAIPADRKVEVFGWLEDKGFGGLINTVVSVQFGKGEMEQALGLQNQLQRQSLLADLKRDVHAQSMKAFIKEQLAEGKEFPLDFFGARAVFTATVKEK